MRRFSTAGSGSLLRSASAGAFVEECPYFTTGSTGIYTLKTSCCGLFDVAGDDVLVREKVKPVEREQSLVVLPRVLGRDRVGQQQEASASSRSCCCSSWSGQCYSF